MSTAPNTARRLWRAAAALALVAVCQAVSVPANADPDTGLLVSGTQVTPGQVRFFLAARGLPPGSSADSGTLTVTAGDTVLPATMERVSSDTRVTPTRAVVLVVDSSGSMAGRPMAAAQAAALEYAESLPPDIALGLVTFADRPAVLVAPTVDRAAFRTATAGLAAKGSTALYDAMVSAADVLGSAYVDSRVVVLSDGADTTSRATAQDAGRTLAAHHAALDVVAFGPAADGPAVAPLVTGSGGQLVAAADAAALKDAFRALAGALSAPVLVTVTVPAQLAGRSLDLHLSLAVGAARAATSTLVRFAVDPLAGTGHLSTVRPPSRPAGLLIVACAAIGAAVLIVATMGVCALIGRIIVRRRLLQLNAFTADRLPDTVAEAHESGFMRAALALSERAVQRPGARSRIEAGLDRAGIDLLPAEWILLRAAVSVGAAVLLALLLPWWLGALLGLPGGWMLTMLYRHFKETRRAAKFADLLPDALHLVVGALRSGFSLAQAIDALVREGPEPVAGEFARAVAETRLGGDLEDAIEGVAERNGSRDLTWLVMAVRIQREVGGNLSEVLQTAVETMRERGRLRRHVHALSAEGRLSAYVLVGMPIVLAGWLLLFRRDYLRPLFSEPLGLVMLTGAALMLGVGAFWMSRVVKVEV